MLYYKHIDIDDFEVIRDKTLSYIDIHGQPIMGFSVLPKQQFIEHCPEIMTAFDRYNIKPVMIALYTTAQQFHSSIHVDYILDNMPQCRINIPILNCEGSRTEFYTGGEYETFYQSNGTPLRIIKDNTAVKVDEVEIIRPTVIRVQEPHRVNTNMEKVPRICMTVMFDVDPKFLLEG